MQHNRYQILVRVVDCGSLTKAAAELHYSQPGISHIIQNIENELGFKLLVRNNKTCHLTPEGEHVIDTIRKLANDEELLMQQASEVTGLYEGKIRVGTMCSVSAQWLPNIITEFRAQHPNISFELMDNDYDISEWMLEKDSLDCAFLPVPNSDHISHDLMFMDPYRVVVSTKHRWAGRKKINIQELDKEPFIMPCEGRNYTLGKLFKESGIEPDVVMSAKDDFGTIAAVKVGLGVTLLTDLFTKNFQLDDYVLIPLETPVYRPLGFSLHKGRVLSPATRRFYDFVLEWGRKNLPTL